MNALIMNMLIEGTRLGGGKRERGGGVGVGARNGTPTNCREPGAKIPFIDFRRIICMLTVHLYVVLCID